VKNGIVMLDYAHHLHERGTAFAEAVTQAARIRLRPILMTTLCTLFGLLPLALGLGAGAELQRPLALVVIGGLSLSTFVTFVRGTDPVRGRAARRIEWSHYTRAAEPVAAAPTRERCASEDYVSAG
jgi:hypothetical protein